MLVGTAITGADASPDTKVGNAPSIPATTTITLAADISGNFDKIRWTPLIPTSKILITSEPKRFAVKAASSATWMSDVPADNNKTPGMEDCRSIPPITTAWASGMNCVSGRASRHDSATLESTLVISTG